MKVWLKAGVIGAIIVLVILNCFMWYAVIFSLEGILTIWFIGILLYPLYILIKTIFNIQLESSWLLVIISALFYTLMGFVIGAIIGKIMKRFRQIEFFKRR